MKRNTNEYIGDQGMVESKDIFGKIVIVLSRIMIVVFIVLGLLALLNP